MDRFLLCLPYTLAQERLVANAEWGDPRNFSDDKHDPGGKTQDGITQAEFNIFLKSEGKPNDDVRHITGTDGPAIYRGNYWLPYCPLLHPGLDLEFFDTSVNEGKGEAIKILQFALGLPVDGQWGSKTTAAVAAIKDVSAIVKAFTARRSVVYKETKGDQFFDKDWQRRNKEIGAAALIMAAAAVVSTPIVAPVKTTWLAGFLDRLRGAR